jgi:hypothetical protein
LLRFGRPGGSGVGGPRESDRRRARGPGTPAPADVRLLRRRRGRRADPGQKSIRMGRARTPPAPARRRQRDRHVGRDPRTPARHPRPDGAVCLQRARPSRRRARRRAGGGARRRDPGAEHAGDHDDRGRRGDRTRRSLAPAGRPSRSRRHEGARRARRGCRVLGAVPHRRRAGARSPRARHQERVPAAGRDRDGEPLAVHAGRPRRRGPAVRAGALREHALRPEPHVGCRRLALLDHPAASPREGRPDRVGRAPRRRARRARRDGLQPRRAPARRDPEHVRGAAGGRSGGRWRSPDHGRRRHSAGDRRRPGDRPRCEGRPLRAAVPVGAQHRPAGGGPATRRPPSRAKA